MSGRLWQNETNMYSSPYGCLPKLLCVILQKFVYLLSSALSLSTSNYNNCDNAAGGAARSVIPLVFADVV